MQKVFGFIGMTLGGWLGWFAGAWVSIFVGFLVSMVGTGVGLYAARRMAKRLLG